MSGTLFEIETVDDLQTHWRDHYIQWWAAGMPSYDQQIMDPYKQITLKFRTKEDREHFAELLGYKLSDRTNVVTYPNKDRDPNIKSRYVEDGFEQDILEEDETEDE